MSSDFYSILGLPVKSHISLVQKAYKLAALRLHPDKNPNDLKAKERFQTLADAFVILSDPDAKAAYDEKIRLEEVRLARIAQLDDRRRGLRESLLARERTASLAQNIQADAERLAAEKFQAELERIKKKQYRSQTFFKGDNFDSYKDVAPSPTSLPQKHFFKKIVTSFTDECKNLSLEEYEIATFQRFKK